MRGDIKRYYERGGLRSKRLRNESTSEIAASELAHNVCTESVRSGGTSAAKSKKIPGPTTCASSFDSFGPKSALKLPSYALESPAYAK